jgi:hypothetical protein
MRFLISLAVCSTLCAQTFQIVPSMTLHGKAGSLLVGIISPAGQEPIALQWRMLLGAEVTAAAGDIVAGDAATASNKVLTCAPVPKPGQEGLIFNCVLAGGKKPILNGTIFRVQYSVKSEVAPHIVPVRISDGIAVSERALQGTHLPPAEGTITIR